MPHSGILGAVLLFVAIQPVDAGPITFTFTGTVTSVTFTHPVSELEVGDALALVIKFESTTTDSTPLSATLGTYNAITAITLNVGSYIASAASGEIRIANDHPVIGDAFQIHTTSLTGPDIDGIPLNASQLQLLDLRDESGTAFGTDALPLVPSSLTPFVEGEFASLRLRFGPPENLTFIGAHVTS